MLKKFLLLFTALMSYAIVDAQVYADELVASGPCTPIVALTCPNGVIEPQNAVDTDLNSYATIITQLGLSLIQNTAFLEVGFSKPGASGNELGILVSDNNKQLSADVINSLRVLVYNENDQLVEEFSSIGLQNLGVLSSATEFSVLTFKTKPADYKIKKIRIELSALVSVTSELNVHGVYYAPACPAILANTVNASQATTNPNNAVDSDPNNFALLNLPLAITNTAFIDVKFPSPANGGDYVGFEVARNNTLLSLGLLQNIRIYGYDVNGNQLFVNSNLKVTDLLLLDTLGSGLGSVLGVGNGTNTSNYILGFNTPSDSSYQIASIRLELAPTIGLLSDLRVYSGFYFSQFKGITITASNRNIVNGSTVTLTAIDGYTNYRWSNGATGRSIIVTTAGTYTVMADRLADGCTIQGTIAVGENNCDANGLEYANEVFATGNCDPIVPLICPSGVQNPNDAVDNDPSSYALLVSQLGVSLIESTAFLELKFAKQGNSGNEIGVLVKSINQTLNADVVDNLTITVLDSAGNIIAKRDNLGLQDIGLLSGSDDIQVIRIATPPSNRKIARVRIEISATANVAQDLAVYGAFYNCSCPAITANTLSASVSVINPERAVDNNPSSFAEMNIPLGILNNAFLELNLPSFGVPGDYVGFEIQKSNLLANVGVIENLTVSAYDENDSLIASQGDFSLADLVAADQLSGVLGGLLNVSNQGNSKPYVIGFTTPAGTYNIAKIRITLAPTIGVLSTLNVYGGFFYSQIFGLPVTASSTFTCQGQDVTLTATSGYINYRWSNGATGQTITVNQPGTYSVIADRNNGDGCSLQGTVVIGEASSFIINTSVTKPNCNTANGSATATISNSTGNYTYRWNTGATTATISNIASGIYFVTVSDLDNGCSKTKQVNVSDVEGPFFQTSVRHANCGQADGAIFIALDSNETVTFFTGDTAAIPVTATIEYFTNANGLETAVLRNLAPGNYTAVVTSVAGCKTIETFSVLNRSNLNLSAEVTNATCNLADNGTINLTVGGGSGTYKYEWSNGAQTQDIFGLAHGIYSVVVTDLITNCQDILYTSVNETSAPVIRVDSLREETCFGDRNGYIHLSTTAPLSTYLWNNGTTNAKNNNLPSAIHTVAVTSAACTSYGIYELIARDPVTLTLAVKNQCGSANNGEVTSVVTGGRTPYTYLWNTGDTTANLVGLVAGDYTLTFTEANGCSKTATATVQKDATCPNGGGNGKNPKATELLTPNGDGFNDKFTFSDLTDFAKNKLNIFNRYSELVYEMKNYDNSWSGTYKDTNQQLPEGTYFYLLETTSGNFRGFFVIKYN